ncbi:hypothetical protein ACFLVV_02850 [Chloroflexota bacterium]
MVYTSKVEACPTRAGCGGRKAVKKGQRRQQAADCKIGEGICPAVQY